MATCQFPEQAEVCSRKALDLYSAAGLLYSGSSVVLLDGCYTPGYSWLLHLQPVLHFFEELCASLLGQFTKYIKKLSLMSSRKHLDYLLPVVFPFLLVPQMAHISVFT